MYSVHFHLHTYVKKNNSFPYLCTKVYSFCLHLNEKVKDRKKYFDGKGGYSWLLLSNGAFDSAKKVS